MANRLQLTGAMAAFSGFLHRIKFTNGVSDAVVPDTAADQISAIYSTLVYGSNVQTGPSVPVISHPVLAIEQSRQSAVVLDQDPAKPKTYLGFTATRGKMPENNPLSAYKQMQSRIEHKARANMRGTTARYINGCGPNGTGPGAATTLRASIEYPLGVFNRVKFGGSTSVSIPDGGFVDCDPWDFDVPDGALLREWTYIANPVACPYSTTCQNVDAGAGGTTTPDLTEAGGVLSGASFVYGAVAFIGQTSKPSILIIGDSRDASLAWTGYGTNDIGVISRAVSGCGGVSNIAVGGANIWQYALTSYAPILDLGRYATHILLGGPINDINGGNTAASCKSNFETLLRVFGSSAISALPASGIPLYIASITRSGSTATAIVLSTAGLATGQSLPIKGASLAAYNGPKTITVTGPNTFTFPVTGSPATPAQGTFYKQNFLMTCEPFATSTDSFATTANQTKVLDVAREGYRTGWNDLVRGGGIVGMTDFFERADQVESARNSGLWRPGTVSLVGVDGLHASIAGEMAMAQAINAARFGTTASLPALS